MGRLGWIGLLVLVVAGLFIGLIAVIRAIGTNVAEGDWFSVVGFAICMWLLLAAYAVLLEATTKARRDYAERRKNRR